MSDGPNGDGGEQDPTPTPPLESTPEPSQPRVADANTLEMQAVTEEAPAGGASDADQSLLDDEVTGDAPGIDTEMLAAFLGVEEPAAAGSAAATDVVTGAPVVEDDAVEENVTEESVGADVLTGAPVDDPVVPPADEAVVVEAEVAQIEETVEVSATDETAEVTATDEVVEVMQADEAATVGVAAGPATHAAPRRSVWPTILTIAGVIVALVAVGAAGVYAGRMTATTPTVVMPTDTAGSAGTEASAPMAVGPLPVPAPGTFLVTTARVPTSTWPVVVNDVGQLPDDAGTAPGYRLINSGISGGQVASILATTFGATGTVAESDTGWTVGGSGEPSVSVTADPLFSWAFEDPAALALPAAGEPLDPAEAISASTQALSGIGVDISTVEYQVDITDGRTGVSAWQLVGDQRTQLGWRLVFDADGSILAASGFSSGLQSVPDYPVVGAATAVARSQQSPWTALPASPISGSPDAASAEVVPSPAATGVPKVDLPMSTVDVVSADLGLAQYWQPDGSILLLPSYILTGTDGSTWSLLAVADSAVSFVDQPFPSTGDTSGFVAGAFPSDDPESGIPDAEGAGDGVSDPAGAEDSGPGDAGVTDGDGNVEFAPSEDPAATE